MQRRPDHVEHDLLGERDVHAVLERLMPADGEVCDRFEHHARGDRGVGGAAQHPLSRAAIDEGREPIEELSPELQRKQRGELGPVARTALDDHDGAPMVAEPSICLTRDVAQLGVGALRRHHVRDRSQHGEIGAGEEALPDAVDTGAWRGRVVRKWFVAHRRIAQLAANGEVEE